MNATVDTLPASLPNNKPLWAAVGVLGVAVLAMGATLIRIQSLPEDPHLAVLPVVATAPAVTASAVPASLPPLTPAVALETHQAPVPKKVVSPVHHAKPVPKPIDVQQRHAPVATMKPVEAPVYAPVVPAEITYPPVQVNKPICSNCGTVVSVTPLQRDGSGSGMGAVAGGVLGGVLGNQVGGGTGKTLATMLGVFGGSIAGNTVEKKMNKSTS